MGRRTGIPPQARRLHRTRRRRLRPARRAREAWRTLGVLISDTDHLSDREIYADLLAYGERITMTFPDDPYSNAHWSPIGSCTEEDMAIHHRLYANDEDRERWAKEFPEDELPPYPRPRIPSAVPRSPRRERIEP